MKCPQTSDGLTASLYKDGQQVGTAENGGTGEPSLAYFDTPHHRAALSTGAATLGPRTLRLLGLKDCAFDFSEEVTPDELLALCEEEQFAKKLNRDARKKLLKVVLDAQAQGHRETISAAEHLKVHLAAGRPEGFQIARLNS
ncbi:hypothetical protein [Deinococcus hopiensis]|uniref:Uncharacterized protein n=1 Tax=Deinococcus hopiensis KR-140 TaxID=695939 RepID=A0A1W1UE20_9DEIO|nr:hypothetical protein [Deinococcus hopiensis]SMB79289.1 hypothetical protein SAMN00790413_05870 [Deinococcus hopiensis KR-140]